MCGVYLNPRTGRCSVCGRESAGTGSGPDAARIADEEGTMWDDDPRLQTQWDHLPVCGTECAGGKVIGSVTRGIGTLNPEVSAADRS